MKFKQWVVCESDKREELLQTIIQNPYATIRFVEKLLRKNMPIPDIVIQSIANRKDVGGMPDYVSALIRVFLENKTPVPEEFLKIVAEYSVMATNMADVYIEYDMEVPEILLKSVAEDPFEARRLASTYKYHKKPVPKILVIAAKKPPYSVRRIISDDFKKI